MNDRTRPSPAPPEAARRWLWLYACAQPSLGAYAAAPDAGWLRDCSEATAREIDLEVKECLASAYAEAKRILVRERAALERIAEELLQHESIDGARFQELLRPVRAA